MLAGQNLVECVIFYIYFAHIFWQVFSGKDSLGFLSYSSEFTCLGLYIVSLAEVPPGSA